MALFSIETATAQAPVATPEEAITGLLNRIGGNGAADKFEIVIDANLAENGKDVFVITAQNGKPCIKGNTQLSVATGINWYLNHYAHINLTWNNLTTDLSQVELPVPTQEEKHVSSAAYRYDFNTCTFSYSMAFWTWDRWQKEIDWMALHGINAPLNLVGLDVVTRKFLRELGVSESDINAYIAGPGFIAWFAMNNLEGWGGTINSSSTGVDMSGNPDWWYTRQEQLCRNMLQRMRELGMQPVIPGFSGQVPNCIVNYSIDGFSSGDVVDNGSWAGGYTRPDILKPNTESYRTFAAVYYKHLHEVMGVSELYSIDPFHEGSLPGGVANETCYPNIMVELDKYYSYVSQEDKTKNNVDEQPKWIIQYWQGVPQSGAFTAMKNASYTSRFIGLDLFADNIYADNAAKWRTNYYDTCPYIYCMLHNFGGRSGLHGRLETTMDGYFQALAKNNNCQGIGATPEGTETNPILYDMLFELPWMDSNPGADAWLAEYAHSRYGVDSETAPAALEALKNLKKSVWDCRVNQQGTSEAVILARPNWTIGSVSSWSTSAIYWDTQDVLLAADQLYSVKDLVTANGGQDGIANYNYDFIDVVRQAMVDYAAQLLPLINAARGNDAEYTRLYQLYLQLMLDLDTMLSYDENFKLERWTSLARNIADEVAGTTDNDRNWLEWNARTQVTVWSKGNTDLHDYSNRCWAGLIKDFHYWRWKYFFENNGNAPSGGWFSGFEYPWTVDFNGTYDYAGDYSQIVIPDDMTATEKAAQTFGKYFGRVKGATKNYIFPMGVATNATKSDVIPEVYRGQEVELPLIIGKNVTISSVWVDLNNDGNAGNGETLTANGNNVTIPADAAIGKTTAKVTYSDGTVITFNLALIEDITDARTVTAAAGANGSVAIEGTNELSITTTEAVKITATANTGYNFENWTDAQGNVVSNDNPFIYYGKEEATFTANFIQDKWGVVACNGSFSGDIASYAQFIHNLTFAYYNREAETILETTTAPTEIFNTIPQIVNVPQGASFDVKYDNGNSDGLKYCYFRAFIDLNQDGDFDDEGELLKTVGTDGAANTAVCSNKINVLLPYDMPLGITHMRLRFDGAWDNSNKPSGRGAKDASIRPVYEIIINVTEKSDKAATINVETNSAEWGTVEVWTDETPDGSTGTQWVVSANIPMYLRATKASEDVEFLGWYDQYGRLVTENPEHTMYAREDATYTARFRKFLEIDGWQIEYRTEPGKDVVTTKLANGVKPEAGKKYYIYADTYYNGAYVNRYLYNNSGTLALNTSVGDANYMWLCSVDGENYTFQNVADPTKYLKHKGIQDSPYKFKLGTGTISHEGITIYSVDDSRYLVTKNDGSVFDQATGTFNQSNGDWNTDYVFTEVSVPEVVILTKVRKSGDHDLEIPESVEILGQQCKIVGFDNNLFKDNKDLWSISLPATIEEMSNNKVFTGVVKGKGANASADASNYITTDLGTTLAAGEDWSISLTIQDNGNNFNEWGSALIATGNAPMNGTYSNGFQLYMQSTSNGGKLIVKLDNDNNNNALASISKGTKYRIDIVYTHANTQLVVTATSLESAAAIAASRAGAARASNSLTLTQDMSDFSVVSHAIPEGVNITNLEVTKGTVPDPFEGCTNLCSIEVEDGNANYYVNETTGALMTTGGTELHTLAENSDEKLEALKNLGVLIENMKVLTAQVGTYNPTGKATAVEINNTVGSTYYIYSNAKIVEGSIEKLWDNSSESDSYIHTTWSENSADGLHHYLRVYLGEDPELNNFSFSYITRDNGNTERPKQITVSGCNTVDGVYEEIVVLTDLPNGAKTTYNSPEAYDVKDYKYLRFMVDDTYRELGNSGHKAYSMAEFDLYKMTSTATVHKIYEGTELTNEFAAGKYDVLLDAINVSNYGTTVAQLTDAATALSTAYDELKEKMEAAVPFKLTTDEENPVLYKIFIKRTPDVTVLKYDEPTKMVAVENAANNSSWQAWYFMNSANGFTIHPYNGDGKVLGASSTASAHSAVSATAKGELKYYEWKLVQQNDGYWNIRVYDDSNYFSNNGGTGNKMGFWHDDPSGDTGSLFKFIDAEFENDNARFYQLSDVKAPMVDGTNIYGGTSVGLYTGGKEYREAYTAAAALETAGNTSASDECHTAYKALRNADEGLVYNAPDANKVYYIISTATNDYCAGEYVRTYRTPTGRSCWAGTNTYDQTHLLFDAETDIEQMSLAAFQFEETGTQGEYKMKNLHTGMYVKAFAGMHMGAENDAAVVKIAGVADGQVTLKIGNNAPMHAQNDYGVIVQWNCDGGNADSPSSWTINEVAQEDLNEIYKLTVPESGVTTLNLAFNVVLPDGVTAYEITNVKSNILGEYGYEMTEVAVAGEVLAKNTPVLIVANQGTYNFAVELSDENVKTVQGTMMNGTVVQSAVSEGATKHYLPVSEDDVVVLKSVIYTEGACTMAANSAWVETTVVAESIKPYEEGIADGVYKIMLKKDSDGNEYDNSQLSIAYNTTFDNDWIGNPDQDPAKYQGYKMIVTEAGENADSYFTIVKNGENYSFQAQGMYLKQQQDDVTVEQWRHSSFSENENEAGTYLFEETDIAGLLKVRGNNGDVPYLNAWSMGNELIIGNNEVRTYSTFSFVPVTEYTLTVPANGVTTLWLPFNVVLPEGVTAYDVNSFETQNGLCKYTLTELAVAGETLAKNTPVVIEAEPGNYTLKITMNNEGAIPSASGSALRGNYWERNLAAGGNNYQPDVTADGLVFNRVDAATTVAANTAWLKLTENKGAVIYKELPEGPDAPTVLTDGAVYRIKGRLSNGNFRTVYTNGAGNRLRWTSDAKNDATTLFVAQETADGKFKLVSALGNGLWNNERVLDEDGVGLTLLSGTVDGTFAIRGNGERIFSAHGTSGEMNMYSDGNQIVNENETTNFVFEEVTDANELAKVAFNKIIRKGNHYATLFLPYNVTVPENVKAYTATIENKDQQQQGVISLVKIADGIIPARTAVILRREDNTAIGEFSFKYTTDASSYDYEGNLFGGRVTTGYVGSDNVNEIYYLLLNTDTKGEALYKVYREYNSWGEYVGENNGGYIKCEGNKGYMKLDVANGVSSSYSFRIEGSTGIEDVEGENGDVKAVYDLQGRKLTEITEPGIYIINGKKILVK